MKYSEIKIGIRLIRFIRNVPKSFRVNGLSRKIDGTSQKVYFEDRNGKMYVQSKKEFENTKWSKNG